MMSGAQPINSEQSYSVYIGSAPGRHRQLEGPDITGILWIRLNLEHALMEGGGLGSWFYTDGINIVGQRETVSRTNNENFR